MRILVMQGCEVLPRPQWVPERVVSTCCGLQVISFWEGGKDTCLTVFSKLGPGRTVAGVGANYNSQKALLPGESGVVAMVSENNMAALSWDASLPVRRRRGTWRLR